jgi:hypothetical protein
MYVNLHLLYKAPTVFGASKFWTQASEDTKNAYKIYKKNLNDKDVNISEKHSSIISNNMGLFEDMYEREKLLDTMIKGEQDSVKKIKLQNFKDKFLYLKDQKVFQKTLYDFYRSLDKGDGMKNFK